MTIAPSTSARRTVRLVGMASAAALALTGFTASAASAAPVTGALDCAAPELESVAGGRQLVGWDGIQKDPHNFTDAEKIAMERNFQAAKDALGFDLDVEDIKEPIDIDVYFHIVRKDRTVEGGNIPRKWLRAQMKYFNHSFRGHGHGEPGARSPFQWHLADATRTTNQDWYVHEPGSPEERAMKTALREESSTAETLNVYLTNLTAVGLLGYAYFPEDYEEVGVLDGVVAESQSLPGGSVENYDLGGTVVHEVGHWLGLLHTFDGGCGGGPGDLIDDTPKQAEPTTGCPEGKDSCPDDPGNDPIHNYMDYSYDECYTQFTLDQRERMLDQWFAYRDGVAVAG